MNEVRVSTVWIGIWILPEEFGVPMLYETLVFGGPRDGQGERYPNRVAALAGHDRWVAEVCDAQLLGDPDAAALPVSPYPLCRCHFYCGDVPEEDDPGTVCKGLPRPPELPP